MQMIQGAQMTALITAAVELDVFAAVAKAYSESDYRGWLSQAGLGNVGFFPSHGMPSTLVTAEKPA